MYSPIPADPSQKNIRILIVEDVDFNLDILTAILAERGWQTIAATSGEAALDILAEDPDFQVIWMDIGLPGMDGLEATRRIKENPACHAIPVIALTAETAAERERFLAAGLDGYAEKNFDPDQLFAAIEKHLLPAGRKQQAAVAAAPASAISGEHPELDFKALFATYADEALICRMAKAFFADTDKQIALLDEAMAVNDRAGVLACCHSLRGSSAIFTAKKLGMAAKELDVCIRQEKKKEADSAWHRVLAAHESLRAFVTSRLNLSLQNE